MRETFDSGRPIYAQLAERLRDRIIGGDYPPGARLDSVRDLASAAGVNPNTMQRALAELERQGLVYTERTAGRFVTTDTGRIGEARLETIQKEIRQFASRMQAIGCPPELLAQQFAALAAQEKAEPEPPPGGAGQSADREDACVFEETQPE